MSKNKMNYVIIIRFIFQDISKMAFFFLLTVTEGILCQKGPTVQHTNSVRFWARGAAKKRKLIQWSKPKYVCCYIT